MWGRVKITDARVVYADEDRDAVAPGESMKVVISLEAPDPVSDVVVAIAIYGSMGWLLFGTNTQVHGMDLGTIEGHRTVTFDFPEVPLLDGTYALTIGVHTLGGLVYDSWEQLRRFEVAAPGRDIGLVRMPVSIRLNEPGVDPGRSQ
jgi:hypothetical protein